MFKKSNRVIQIIAGIAGVFGLLTIISGGSVLFFTSTVQEVVGNFVPFVVLFNFLIGFAYVIAGGGLWFRKKWAVWISFFIASATLVVFVIFGIHILQGELYEIRTIFAMIFRITVWIVISIFAYHQIIHQQEYSEG